MNDELSLDAEQYPGQLSLDLPETVESVVPSRSNGPLLHAAATLWIKPTDRVLDLTYGRGKFWTHYRPALLETNDLNTELDTDYHYDFRETGLESNTYDVVIFDPPYISPGGRDTSTIEDFNHRYGLGYTPATSRELKYLFTDGILEATRLLTARGRLFVKCMDYQEGSTFWTMHYHVVETATRRAGLVQVDELIHYSGTGPQPTGRRQWVSRRAHSFLCIFRK